MPAGSPLFGGLLFGTVIVVAGLSFLNLLCLGPVAEHLTSHAPQPIHSSAESLRPVLRYSP